MLVVDHKLRSVKVTESLGFSPANKLLLLMVQKSAQAVEVGSLSEVPGGFWISSINIHQQYG